MKAPRLDSRHWRVVPALLVLLLAFCYRERSALAQTAPVPEPGARQHEGAAWLGLMTDWQLRGPWSFWFDTHYNSRAFFVVRPGLTYKFASGPSASVGYAYVLTDPGNDSLTRQEHRPWAQLVFPAKFGEVLGFSERLRAELRFRERVENGAPVSGWLTVPRFRAQTAFTLSIVKTRYGELFLQPAFELLVNAGDSVGKNFLDQTRASLMLGFQKGPYTIRAGYMDRFIPSTTPPTHEHDALLWFSYSWKRSEDEPPTHEHRGENQNP